MLATEGTDEEHLVRGERALLTRALVNLLDNAIKYSPGGGTVTGRVAVSAEDSGQLVLTVADQGVGMSSDQAAALFTPFQRFTAPDRRVTDGAGLGLMLVWEVVRRHDGAVAVSSQAGEGTTFTLTLPRATED